MQNLQVQIVTTALSDGDTPKELTIQTDNRDQVRWELARARSLSPWYVACGPVWPTLTKAMPWVPQGLDNLAWWVHMAGVPVVAIGGILDHAQAAQAAQSGASGVCVVRGLGDDPAQTLPAWQVALQAGRAAPRLPVPASVVTAPLTRSQKPGSVGCG